jgi:TolA-binding protein
VFEIEHVTPEFPEGRLADYLAAARGYDRAKLDKASLRELAYLISESGDPNEAIAVGKQFVERFPDAPKLELARMRRLMAENAIRLGTGGLEEAIANYQASITDETPAAEKLDVLARLLRLVGIDRNMADKAGEFLAQVEETFKNNRRTPEVLAAYRRAIIAGGDVLLWSGKRNGARDLYRRAEALSETIIPSQVRSARVGAYPNAVRELITTGNLTAALNIVQRWEEDFPTEKLHGETLFWHGKLQHLRDTHRDAVQFLTRSVNLSPGASFESEARWLLALSLEKLGRSADARRELAKLVATGIQDEYTALAKQKLAADTMKQSL